MMNSQLGMPHHSGVHTLNQSNTNTNTNQSFVRKRTRATAEQLAILEDTFAVNVSPNSKLRKQLAEKLKMNERSIQIWFQNRRAKVKHLQKRAHMQMHQAAMRAQFYHHYPPPPFDSPSDSFMKQPFYFPPHYMMKQPMMDYSPGGFIKSTSVPPPNSRSSFPTPEPPMYYNSHPFNASTPPPHFSSQESLNHWYSPTPTQQSPVVESSNPFSSLNNNVSYQQQLLEKDFLTLDHGPISPSPTPNKEDASPSPTTSHQDKSSEYQSEFFSMPSNTVEDKSQSLVQEPSLFSESELWISTPEVEPYSQSPSIPCYPSFSSSSTVDPNDIQKDALAVTTLMIGTWQRMKYPASDLTCCFEQDKFIWFIEEGGHRFKIEIPVQHIAKIEYALSSDIYIHLSQPPLFYMKSDTQNWIQCSDFTENKQASHYLYHVLKGPHLQQDLVNLMNEYPHLSKIISLN